MHRGFAKVYRKFLEWEWYDDAPCKVLYLHCLLKANHKEKKYRGKPVQRGTFLTGRTELAKQTGLTVQQVRTALHKLEGDYLTSKSTSAGTIISVIDFETYNGTTTESNQRSNQGVTSHQPAINQRVTTTKNVKKDKNVKESNFSTDLEKRVFQSLQISFWERISKLKTVTQEKLVRNLASDLYSGVDVCREIKSAGVWEDNNPSKKKTHTGVSRFLCGWMDRAQNSGRGSNQTMLPAPRKPELKDKF